MQEPVQLVQWHGLQCLLALPTAPRQGPVPLLCFLHGYDEGAPAPIREALLRHGPGRAGNAGVAAEGFISVMPQLPSRGDIWGRYTFDLQGLVSMIQSEHAADPHKTYLTGFSYGGNGVFDVACRSPGLWSALWVVDPTRVPEQDPGLPIWLSSGQVSRRLESEFVQRLKLHRYRPEEVAGVTKDRVVVDYGEDHVGTATVTYRAEVVYRWLLQRSR